MSQMNQMKIYAVLQVFLMERSLVPKSDEMPEGQITTAQEAAWKNYVSGFVNKSPAAVEMPISAEQVLELPLPEADLDLLAQLLDSVKSTRIGEPKEEGEEDDGSAASLTQEADEIAARQREEAEAAEAAAKAEAEAKAKEEAEAKAAAEAEAAAKAEAEAKAKAEAEAKAKAEEEAKKKQQDADDEDDA